MIVYAVYSLLLAEIIAFLISAWIEFKARNRKAIPGMVISLCGILITLLTLQPDFNLWGYIPRFMAVEYHKGPYNEGTYYGEWHNGDPNGVGTLIYGFFGDGKYYTITEGGQIYKALSYTGGFDQGYRNGEGTVFYEGDYREEGTFYGQWMAGKKVFSGRRWLTTETFNGYRELEIVATSLEAAEVHWLGDWVSVDR